MPVYPTPLKEKIRKFRMQGYTYTQIQDMIGEAIPKSTLSYICRDITLTDLQQERINNIILEKLKHSRHKALAANRKILENRIIGYRNKNKELEQFLKHPEAKLVALAMLYLGEGAKWSGRRGLQLGSSSPQIIRLYTDLLRECYQIQLSSLRCRIQHRADQDSKELMEFWSVQSGIPLANFYPCYIDMRTIGKVTLKSNYKGVCSISCAGTHIQLELEQIAGIISDALRGYSAAG